MKRSFPPFSAICFLHGIFIAVFWSLCAPLSGNEPRFGSISITGAGSPEGPPPMIRVPAANGSSLPSSAETANTFLSKSASSPVLEKGRTLFYRRYFVPADKSWGWPVEDGLYAPVRKSDFERWKRFLDHKAEAAERPSENGDFLIRTVLQARLSEQECLVGTGRFTLRPRRILRGQPDRLPRIPLMPLGLFLSEARWGDGTAAKIATTPRGEVELFEHVPFVLPLCRYRYADLPDILAAAAHPDGKTIMKPSSDRFRLASVRDEPAERVSFQWSLQGRSNPGGHLLFDFAMPPALAFELRLTLPAHLVPWSPVGLVLEEPASTSDTSRESVSPSETTGKPVRHWRIVFGSRSRVTLTLLRQESPGGSGRIGVRQKQLWNLTPQGIDVTVGLLFDRAMAPGGTLHIDLESPLRPVEVRYGNKPVPWSPLFSPANEKSRRIAVQLPETDILETQELQIFAQSGITTGTELAIPRIRILSKEFFHRETLATLLVVRPLLVRTLEAVDAARTLPVSAMERDDREVYAFYFFNADSRIRTALTLFEPTVQWNSVTAIESSISEILGTSTAEFSVNEGECYALKLETQNGWIIDSIKTTGRNEILSWELDGSRKPPELNVQWKHAIRPGEPVRLQIASRFLTLPESIPLGELLPIRLPGRLNGTHLLVIDPVSLYRFRESGNPMDLYGSSTASSVFLRQMIMDHSGSTFVPLNDRTRSLHLERESVRSAYHVTINGALALQQNEAQLTYTFLCRPNDSPIDRIPILFTSDDGTAWEWKSGNETGGFQVLPLPPLSGESVDQPAEKNGSKTEKEEGHPETRRWEVRFVTPKNSPFELTATRRFVPGQRSHVPLAAAPQAASQQAEIQVDSMFLSVFQVVNERLKAVPRPLATGPGYQTIRSAYRYDPRRDAELNGSPALCLHSHPVSTDPEGGPPAADSSLPAACAWSLTLDSQYQSDGSVRNNALFFIENTARPSVAVTLPASVRGCDVFAVWVNENRVNWQPEIVIRDSAPAVRLVIDLPEKDRFATVSVEYSYRNLPLTRQRKLRPKYPEIDIPVLSGSWTTWFPPEYDVCERLPKGISRTERRRTITAMRWFLGEFDPFALSDWKGLFQPKNTEHEAEAIARTLLVSLGATDNAVLSNDLSGDPASSASGVPFSGSGNGQRSGIGENAVPSSHPLPRTTWGHWLQEESRRNMLQTAATLATKAENHDMPAVSEEQNNSRERVSVPGDPEKHYRLLFKVDRYSLERIGIDASFAIPASPVSFSTTDLQKGYRALEKSGLSLILIKEQEITAGDYTVLLTSNLTAAKSRGALVHLIGELVWLLKPFRETAFPESGRLENPEQNPALPPENPPPPGSKLFPLLYPQASSDWMTPEEWGADSLLKSLPWPASHQEARFASATLGWTAIETSRSDPEKTLYIVHRNTMSIYGGIAFLALFLLTWRRPFSHPLFLLFLLFAFEVAARNVALCHVPVPGGAFFGTLCSLGFSLVRPVVREPRFSRGRIIQRDPLSTHAESPSGSATLIAPLPRDAFSRSTTCDENLEIGAGAVPEEKEAPHDTDGGNDRPLLLPFLAIVFLTLFYVRYGMAQTVLVPSAREQASSPGETHVPVPTSAGINPSPSGTTAPSTAPQAVPQESPVPYKVLVPVDDTRKPIGDRLWISREFYQQLNRAVKKESILGNRWSISRAEYQGTLVNNPLLQTVFLSNLKATFDIELDEGTVTVSIPLQADSVRWNHAPVQPNWRMSDSGLQSAEDRFLEALTFSVENQRTGTHQLELSLLPPIEKVDQLSRVLLPIPNIPGAILKLNVPAETPPLHVTGSLGAVYPNTANTPQLTAELGATDRLQFSWSDLPVRGETATVNVDQFFLLRAMPKQLDVRAKFRYHITGGKVRQLFIAADSSLQLSGLYRVLVDEQPADLIESAVALSSDQGTVGGMEETCITLKRPTSGVITIRADYVVKDFNGIGSLYQPELTATRSQINRSWLGVMVDPTLEVEMKPDEADPELQHSFSPLWYGASYSTTELPIQTARDLRKEEAPARISIRARTVEPNVHWEDAILFGSTEIAVRAKATIQTIGELHQCTLVAPEGFEIDDVRITDYEDNVYESRLIVSRALSARNKREQSKTGGQTASRQEPHETGWREYTLFLKRPMTETAYLSITGRAPAPLGEKEGRPLPLLFLAEAKTEHRHVTLYRDTQVMVLFSQAMETLRPEPATSATEPPFPGAVLIERIRVDEPAGPVAPGKSVSSAAMPTFQLEMNRPVIRGTQTVSLYKRFKDGMAEQVRREEIAEPDPRPNIPREQVPTTRREERTGEPAIEGVVRRSAGDDALERNSRPSFPKGQSSPNRERPGDEEDIPRRDASETDENRRPFESIPDVSPRESVWEVLTVFDLKVEKGEVDTLVVEHDKLCRGMTLVDSSEWTAEWKEGEMVLRPKTPIRDTARFALRSEVAVFGEMVVLPKITLRSERSLLRGYVVLPNEFLAERYSWDLELLTPANPGTTARVLKDDSLFRHEEIDRADPESLANHRRMKKVYTVAGADYRVSIRPPGEGTVVTLADTTLFVRQNGIVYGIISYDIRGGGVREALLRLPPGFRAIVIRSGSDVQRETPRSSSTKSVHDSGERYKVSLWYDLPQRIELIFEGESQEAPHSRPGIEERRFTLPLPEFEGVPVQETIWTLNFEASNTVPLPRFSVEATVNAVSELAGHDPGVSRSSDTTTTQGGFSSGNVPPVPRRGEVVAKSTLEKIGFSAEEPADLPRAVAPLLQLNMGRMENLLRVASQISSVANLSSEELLRWHAVWGKIWWELKRDNDALARRYQGTEYGKRMRFIQEEGATPHTPLHLYLHSIDPTRRTGAAMGDLWSLAAELRRLDEQHRAVVENYGLEVRDEDIRKALTISTRPTSLWKRSHFGREGRLFGVAAGKLTTLRMTAVPASRRFIDSVPFHYGVWGVILVIGVLLVFDSPVRRFYRRFPFFWGIVIGTLLWLVFPPGLPGLLVIFLTLVAMYCSPWRRAK